MDLLASLLAGVARNTDKIMARHMATSSLAAQAKGGERPRPSTAVTEAPLPKSVSTTSIMPKGAAKCKGLKEGRIINYHILENTRRFVLYRITSGLRRYFLGKI